MIAAQRGLFEEFYGTSSGSSSDPAHGGGVPRPPPALGDQTAGGGTPCQQQQAAQVPVVGHSRIPAASAPQLSAAGRVPVDRGRTVEEAQQEEDPPESAAPEE